MPPHRVICRLLGTMCHIRTQCTDLREQWAAIKARCAAHMYIQMYIIHMHMHSTHSDGTNVYHDMCGCVNCNPEPSNQKKHLSGPFYYYAKLPSSFMEALLDRIVWIPSRTLEPRRAERLCCGFWSPLPLSVMELVITATIDSGPFVPALGSNSW